jgi:tetratricopeptide (TPR) repeat protein
MESASLARLWGATGEEDVLNTSRSFFRRSTELEPNVSVAYANLAILDWQAREQELAILEMEKAVELSPLEPVFSLNLGWFYEQMGLYEKARNAYQRTLEIKPQWSSHPFWQANTFRQQVMLEYGTPLESNNPSTNPFINLAWQEIQSEDWNKAEEFLIQDLWANKESPEASFLRGLIAEGKGDDETARQHYAELVSAVDNQKYILTYRYVWQYYISAHRREGFLFSITPGYLKLTADIGQFDALRRLQHWYEAEGQSQHAEAVGDVLIVEPNQQKP